MRDPNLIYRSERYEVRLAASDADVHAVQRLRFEVFQQDMPLSRVASHDGFDADIFDPFCDHLMVVDCLDGNVVGTYRLMTESSARRNRGFFYETEFEGAALYDLPGEILEVGRAAVLPRYRDKGVISLLWHGLCVYLVTRQFSYFFGLCSMPASQRSPSPSSVYRHLRDNYVSPDGLMTQPLAQYRFEDSRGCEDIAFKELPTLLKGYLRLGARLVGGPSDDGMTVSFPILLPVQDIAPGYFRRFRRYMPEVKPAAMVDYSLVA